MTPANALFLILGIASVSVAALGERMSSALRFERAAVADGELWRLLSAHLVHLSIGHLWLNLAGLALVAWLVGTVYGARAWAAILVASAVAVSVSLFLFHPQIQWYVGLSGVLHGLLAGGLLPGLARHDRESLILLGLLTAKLAWEAIFGPLPGSQESAGGPVLVESHLYGAAGGMLAAFAIAMWARRERSV